MTREEAIKILQGAIKKPNTKDGYLGQALDMAIKALKQEPVYFPPYVDCNTKMNEIREAYDKLKDQEPCEDAVSRAEALKGYIEVGRADGVEIYSEKAVPTEYIKNLPSVTPVRNGWIPVSERLPEKEGLYLVSVKNEHDRRYSKTCWFHGNGNWFARQDVIAWMPLPEPYKADMRGSENEAN